MSWGRRTTTAAVLALTGPWLAGCGTGEQQQAEAAPIKIPGSTVTVGTTATPLPERLDQSVTTMAELLARVGAAMGEFDTVRITTEVEGGGAAQEGDYRYLAGDDYVVRVLAGPGPLTEYRKVDDDLYYLPAGSDDWQRYDPATAPTALRSLLSEAAAYSLLTDLRQQLGGTDDPAFAADGPAEIDGTPVETYGFSVDLADLVQGEGGTSDLPLGPVEVELSIDDTGLPVREGFVLSDGTALVQDFGGWGDPVTVDVPELN